MALRKVDVYTRFVILSDHCVKNDTRNPTSPKGSAKPHNQALYIAACQSELNVVLHQYLIGNLIILVALTMF